MEQTTITFFAGILSLIMIIVFFIMAWHIGKILKELRNMKDILMVFAEEKNLASRIECPFCHFEFKTINSEKAACPHCNAKIDLQNNEKVADNEA